jgi:hypothetical protein
MNTRSDPKHNRTRFGDEESGQVAATASGGGGVVVIRVFDKPSPMAIAILSTDEARDFAAHILARANHADGKDLRVPVEMIEQAEQEKDGNMLDALTRAGMRFGVRPTTFPRPMSKEYDR